MLKTIKVLLGISAEDSSKDELLDIMLTTASDMAINYCHIDSLPDGLKGVVVRMAVDIYRAEGYGQASGGGSQIVQQVKRGDTAVTYAQSGGNYNIMTGAGGADFVKNYTKQLNAYRQVVFK